MKAVRLNEFGDVDVLKIEAVPEPNLRPHHVMIKVDSAGVNYADILRRGGNYPGPGLPSSMGLESAGTVTEVGSDVTSIIVGQQVMAMGPGSQAEYVAVNGNLVFPYPNSLDAVEAGGMPIVFLTAYHILKSRGHMQSGDTVLVQAGASGVGTVLIQLAKAWGAKVIATASTQAKLDLCKSRGADVLIIDTAGRLHTKSNLMEDLRKINRVLQRLDPTAPHQVILTMDATTGHNGLAQAKSFKDTVNCTGIFLSKLDGTARGGIVLAIKQELQVPILFIGTGEGLEDLAPFDTKDFVDALLAPVSKPRLLAFYYQRSIKYH